MIYYCKQRLDSLFSVTLLVNEPMLESRRSSLRFVQSAPIFRPAPFCPPAPRVVIKSSSQEAAQPISAHEKEPTFTLGFPVQFSWYTCSRTVRNAIGHARATGIPFWTCRMQVWALTDLELAAC